VGDALQLEWTGELDGDPIEDVDLVVGSVDDDEDETTGEDFEEVLQTYRKVLATIHATDPGGNAEQLAEDLWVRYRVADADLRVIRTVAGSDETAGHAFPAIEFVPI